jgi:8-oxo-dGTP pyrophosphatase MutT (NUDIX family)
MPPSDSPRPWPVESSEKVHEYPIFDVYQDRVRSPRTGELHDFFVVDAPRAVVVVALTARGEVVMVEQYRHGIREVTLELPAGILDGDEPEAGGLRELREETGYEVSRSAVIGVLDQNPAWETTRVHVVVGEGAERKGEQELDAAEDTRVRLVARDRIPALVAEGTISSAIALAALYLFEARGA